MKTLLALLLLTLTLYSQEKQNCPHPSNIERFKDVRVLPPARISRFDGITLEYIIEDNKEIISGTFTVNPLTFLPKDFLKNHKGQYFLIYCEKHAYLYEVSPYQPK